MKTGVKKSLLRNNTKLRLESIPHLMRDRNDEKGLSANYYESIINLVPQKRTVVIH